MIPFGQTILLWRLERGLTQGQLAEKAGVSRPNLSSIERGACEVTVKTVRALALALNINPGSLVDGLAPRRKDHENALKRESLERIAQAVVNPQIQLKTPTEKELAELIKPLVQTRLRSINKKIPLDRRNKRKVTKSWLLIRSKYGSDVLDSLVKRITEKASLTI